MTGSRHRDDGRRPGRRLARVLGCAAVLWAGAAAAQQDGMIVIPGRGETAEAALAQAGSAAGGAPGESGGPGANAASGASGFPGANATSGTAALRPAGSGTLGTRPAVAPAAPAVTTTRPATVAADPNRVATVIAGTPAAEASGPASTPRAAPSLARARPAAPRNAPPPAKAPAAKIAAAAAAATPAATPAPATPAGQQDGEAVRRAALAFLEQQSAGLPGKTTVTVSAAFPRGLAACATLEPFLPTGARLWGRTTVGVRCAGERPWTIYLQAKVAIQATYYVATRQIAPGEPLAAADLVARDGDLATLPRTVVTDPAQAVGATALARVAAGLPLRQDMLKSAASVSPGQTVRVVAAGQGFTITAEGSTLGGAAPGQPVKVRMAAGQIVTAIVKDAGTVELPL